MIRGTTGGDPHRHGAHSTEEWSAHALAEVARAGHRSGGARAAVIASLAAQECCRSAQEIFDQLRAEGRRVGIASVYRVLDLLVSLGLVQRLDLGGGVARYEPALPTGEHHHHLVCVDCGEVRPFEDPQLERVLEGTATRSDYTVEGHDVVLKGRCPDCRAGQRPPSAPSAS
jgi:Fur family transcriptional regulator, ferric uptake regulator